MSAKEQQTSTISTTEEILNEQPEYDEQRRVYLEDDDAQNLQEVHQNSYQAAASSSTAESSNRTLHDDNLEQNPAIPRLNLPLINPRDRYTFSFSAELIA